MDDGGNPYIIIMIMMGAVIVVLAMALIMVIMRFRDTIKKQLLKSAKGEQKSAEEEVQEEIISMLNEGHEQGVFLGNEAEMIQNIFDFSDNGIPNYGGTRDYIDTTKLTMFQLRFNSNKAGRCRIVSENLARLV